MKYQIEIAGGRGPDLSTITLDIEAESDQDLQNQWEQIKAAHFNSDAKIIAVATLEPGAPDESEAPTEPETRGGEQ